MLAGDGEREQFREIVIDVQGTRVSLLHRLIDIC